LPSKPKIGKSRKVTFFKNAAGSHGTHQKETAMEIMGLPPNKFQAWMSMQDRIILRTDGDTASSCRWLSAVKNRFAGGLIESFPFHKTNLVNRLDSKFSFANLI
jgi:hypothetical protein